MSRMFHVVNQDEERLARSKRIQFAVALLIGLSVLAYPQLRLYEGRWKALVAARSLAVFIQGEKGRAIVERKPMEIRFTAPGTIEVFRVSSCGIPGAREKVASRSLSEFAPDVSFLSVQAAMEAGESHVTLLRRFCYDPLQGSSLPIDGIVHGALMIAAQGSPEATAQSLTKLSFTGIDGETEID